MPAKKTDMYIKFGYVVLAILFIIIFCSCINFKNNKIEYNSIRNNTNINSNKALRYSKGFFLCPNFF